MQRKNKIKGNGWRLLPVSLFFLFTACRGDIQDYTAQQFNVDNSSVKLFSLEPLLAQCRFVKLGDVNDVSSTLSDHIYRFYYYNHKYWIFYRYSGSRSEPSIKVFDDQGSLEKIIPLMQGGPSDFKALADFWTDWKNMELLDVWDQSIWASNYPNEKFVRKAHGSFFSRFYKISNNIYVFDNTNSPSEFIGNNNLALFDIANKKLIDQALPIKPYLKDIGIGGQRFSYDNKTSEVFYLPPVGTDIYRISTDSIKVALQIEYTRGAFREAGEAGLTTERFLALRRGQKFITTHDAFLSSGDFGIAQYRFDGSFYWTLLDRKTGKAICIKPNFPFATEFFITYRPVFVNEDNEIAFLTYPFELLNYYQENPEIKGRFPKLENLIKTLQPEDNPVVMWVPLKILEHLLE